MTMRIQSLPIQTTVGLIFALGSLPCLTLLQRTPPDSWFGYTIGLFSLTLVGSCVLALVLWWERLPLTSIGLKPPTIGTVIWGLVMVCIQLYVITPVGTIWVTALELPSFNAGIDKLQDLPRTYLLALGVISGCVEELCYRGYATERLGTFTGKLAFGGCITLMAFALSHLPFWGLGGVFFTLLGGSLFTLFYLWQRDLLANMLAHAAVASIQLLSISG
ncbi:CPBP family intramembrane glutamic endopeptidase [Acaryochloris sp. IP29b_bin.137]|uniref:CPBP family intramembrane glutamic endopeptidase n=1 Tax=Acaryochloris sp. IP29b_bin.137 TaxID=2969217 RepID=UPI0026024B5F|nr:CPBP family intramembrane glutamic endopeptidase [Acaryochloris sp. IP29b_bin.137]